MSNEKKIRVGITQGDTNGIGIEVALKVLSNPAICELCTPLLYGAGKVIAYHRKALEMANLQMTHIDSADKAREGMANLVECCPNEEIKVELGRSDKQAGHAAFMALEAAVADLKSGLIDVLVTAPINKESIQCEEFQFPGHTEYLESATGDGDKALMVLTGEQLRVALVTTHLPLAQVPQAITAEAIREKLRIFDRSLRRDFGIDQPRIAVLALNPHAGENGLLGNEEVQVIAPAIAAAADEERIMCFGPFPADGFFGANQYRHFDGVLAMYHDQGLAAFKTIEMERGVNFTAGLSIVRTSPDHGTGYDIAGKGVADEQSMRSAIYTAIDIYRHRADYDEARTNPLRRQFFDRGKDNVVLDLTGE